MIKPRLLTPGFLGRLVLLAVPAGACPLAWSASTPSDVPSALPSETSPAIPDLGTIDIKATSLPLLGLASTAGEGSFTGIQINARPLARPADALESIPGLVVTQHAGNGKANQYFLRGFNLDHGTDFATFVGGVPVNMPSHAHGQGYTDLGFLIPELVDRADFRKGPYHAEEGDFSSAGSVRIHYLRRLKASFAQLTVGAGGFQRGLVAGSPAMGAGHLLYALEWQHQDGPWQVAENYRKLNAVLRYSEGSRDNGFSLTGMAYQASWTSTDQVPQRAIDSGQLGRYDSLDPSSGGRSSRISLAAQWARSQGDARWKADLWLLRSGLSLFSNFQYCLNDIAATGTCARGDQFQQREQRTASGLSLTRHVETQWQEREVSLSMGLQARLDHVAPLGLFSSVQGVTQAALREDRVRQGSVGVWAQAEVRWSPWLRSMVGLRADAYRFDVRAQQALNSGRAQDALLTPKASLVFSPGPKTELFLSAGHGFHSNDARGTTLRVDPANAQQPAPAATPLVRTQGVELGLRHDNQRGWQSTLTAWQLRSGSELLYAGDAGTTVISRPSYRHGIEWSNVLRFGKIWKLEADLSWSRARFRDADPAGDHVPGALGWAAHLGLTMARKEGVSGALWLRYVGARALTEDNTVRSQPSLQTSVRLSYALTPATDLHLDVHNLFNARYNDIEYFYESQLRGEARPVADRHVHPGEPRSLRLTLVHRF